MTVGFPYPALIVDPQSVSTSVTITDTNGNTASAYTDAYGLNPVTFPDVISARKTYYMPGEGPWTVTPTVDGVAKAGQTLSLGSGQEAGTVLVSTAYARSTQLDAYVPVGQAVTPFTAKPASSSTPPYNIGIYAVRGLDLAHVMEHTLDPTYVIKAALRRGFEFIWVSDLYNAMLGTGSLPEKPILLSYDDGRSQLWSVVKPVIDTYGIKCNAFITSDFTDGNPDGLVDGTLSPYLPGATWANLQAMGATGLWEFHNHTRIHAALTGQASATRISDLETCNSEVKSNLGQTPIGLSYPNGAWNPSVVQDAITAGLKLGFDFGAGSQHRTGGWHSKMGENPWSNNRLQLTGASSDAALLENLFDSVIYSYANDFPGMRNDNNQLGYWTMPNTFTGFDLADQCSIKLDTRVNPGVAAVATTTDYFRVPYGKSLYYNFWSESEIQTTGNAWVKIKQWDINKSPLADIVLINYTAAAGYTHHEGETILAATTAYVTIEVGYDATYNGLIHYQSGTVEVVG